MQDHEPDMDSATESGLASDVSVQYEEDGTEDEYRDDGNDSDDDICTAVVKRQADSSEITNEDHDASLDSDIDEGLTNNRATKRSRQQDDPASLKIARTPARTYISDLSTPGIVDSSNALSAQSAAGSGSADPVPRRNLFDNRIPNTGVDKSKLFEGNIMSPEYYRNGTATIGIDFSKKTYSPNFQKKLDRSKELWQEFCVTQLQITPEEGYTTLDEKIVFSFLHWHLNQKTGKDGRVKPPMRSGYSLRTFWCDFRVVFLQANGFGIDEKVDETKVQNIHHHLCEIHHLNKQRSRENRPMTIDDLKSQILTTVQTTAKAFGHGEHRILAVLFLLLMAPAGARPSSILELRFRDLDIFLARDPAVPDGPSKLCIKYTLRDTKEYLGQKAWKTFYVPEIIWEPTWLLSPHVFLLGLLHRHQAFAAHELNESPERLAELCVVDGDSQLNLLLKDELQDLYLFRRADRDVLDTDDNEPITYSVMAEWIRSVGKLAGFKWSTIGYTLRYMAGNSLDQNQDISEALRNMVMDHTPNSSTFQTHYLNRNISLDVWAIHRGLAQQQALMKQITSHGASKSPRRPCTLPPEVLAEIKQYPILISMQKELQPLPAGSPIRLKLSKDINALKARLKRAALKDYIAAWEKRQAIDDVNAQFTSKDDEISQTIEDSLGTGPEITVNDPTLPATESQPMTELQQRLVDALTAPLEVDLAGQLRRRTNAITAIAQYCKLQHEPIVPELIKMGPRPTPPELGQQGDVPDNLAELLRESVTTTHTGERVLRCFVCVGKAIQALPDTSHLARFIQRFYDIQAVTRHFVQSHLKDKNPESNKAVCPICVTPVIFSDKEHFQAHAAMVHGVWSPPPQKPSRKERDHQATQAQESSQAGGPSMNSNGESSKSKPVRSLPVMPIPRLQGVPWKKRRPRHSRRQSSPRSEPETIVDLGPVESSKNASSSKGQLPRPVTRSSGRC